MIIKQNFKVVFVNVLPKMYKLVVITCDISIYKKKHAQVIFRHNKKKTILRIFMATNSR